MTFRPWHRFKFEIERLILRSPFHRLAVIAMAVGAVSCAGGYLAYFYAGGFADVPDAVWWAFLRLTDPGYLGDDVGNVARVISTTLTILGYVLFLGALIAIMTQSLNQSIQRLQQGLTPIVENNHFLILGWTSTTPTLVEELILSEGRVKRFLKLRGTGRLRIVILIEDLGPEIVQDLQDRLGSHWNSREIIVRSGTPLRLEHLERVDFLHAAAIMLPLPDVRTENTFARDERTIKVLLSISSSARQKKADEVPMMVAELMDGRNVSLAQRAYGGPIEILAGDLLVSRLIAQNVRHAGLSPVYAELLSHSEGNEIYLREWPELAGRRFDEVGDAFSHAIVLGVLRMSGRGFDPLMLPEGDLVIEAGDRLVMVAQSYEESAPERHWSVRPRAAAPHSYPLSQKRSRRVLLLGWNHKVPALVAELARYGSESFEVDVVSLVKPEDRATHLRRHGIGDDALELRNLEADFTSSVELRGLKPEAYDNVVILASDRMDSEVESDARTILGFLLLDEILTGRAVRPEVLVELMDADNVPLLQGRADVLISPLILAHMLSQVALRRELRVVFDEMFGSTGVEISLRPASDVISPGETVEWGDLSRRVECGREIALGMRRGGELPKINPPRNSRWSFSEGDELLVLTRNLSAGAEVPSATSRRSSRK